MSPNNPGNFVNDLVEMAKAFEALPKVQAELEQVRDEADRYLATTQRLELKLMERANEIESLNQRIRSLEVERDDAQFHALEADDRTGRALDFIKATFGNAGSLIQALEPAPVKPTGQSEANPTASVTPPDQPTSAITNTSTAGANTQSHSDTPQGQSEPLPSSPVASPVSGPEHAEAKDDASASPAPEVAPAHPTATETDGMSATAPTPNAETRPDANTTYLSERFSGRRYSDVVKSSDYPTLEEWEANGGTIDNWYA